MPYNPGVSYQGDRYIFEGGQRMWQALASLIGSSLTNAASKDAAKTQLSTQLEMLAGGGAGAGAGAAPMNPMAPGQEGAPSDPSTGTQSMAAMAQRGQQADAIRKLVQSYAPDAKDLHTGLKAMSADQLEGMLKGITLRQAADEVSQKQALWQAQMQQHQAMMNQIAQKSNEASSLENFARDFASGPPQGQAATAAPGVDPGQELSPGAGQPAAPMTQEQRMLYALSKNPQAFSAGQFDNSVLAMQRLMKQPAGTPGSVTDLPGAPGHKFVWQTENSGSAIPVVGTGEPTTTAIPGAPNSVLVTDQSGKSHVVTTKPPAEKLSPIMQTKVDIKRSQISDLDGQIQTLSLDIAKRGEKAKNGPDWNPLASTLGEQLQSLQEKKAQVEAELDALGRAPAGSGTPLGSTAVPAAPGKTNAPASSGSKTNLLQDFNDWVKSRK